MIILFAWTAIVWLFICPDSLFWRSAAIFALALAAIIAKRLTTVADAVERSAEVRRRTVGSWR